MGRDRAAGTLHMGAAVKRARKRDEAGVEPPRAELPRPKAWARWMLRAVWGDDAPALQADLRSAAEARGASRVTWTELAGVLLHGLRPSVRRDGRDLRRGRVPRTGRTRLRPGLALRLALRGLRRDPITSTAVVGILSLGLAAPTVFFSLLWGGGLRPLPVPDGDRIVRVDVTSTRTGAALDASVEEWSLLQPPPDLEGLAGYADAPATARVDGWGGVRLARAALTPGALELVGVRPILGRVPGPGEGLLLGAEVWRSVFDGDPRMVGTEIEFDGRRQTIVGIMPEGFGFPLNHDAWSVIDPASDRSSRLTLFGRLVEGGELDRAGVALTARWLSRDGLRKSDRTSGVVTVRGFTEGRGEAGEDILFFGLVVVGVALLIIAGVNASHLLMVRALERVRLLGVQAALGAGRAQIALQLFLEAFVLAAVAGVVGLGLTHVAIDAIQRTGSENFGYWWMRMQVEWPVVAFASLLVLGTSALAGLVPVTRVLRLDLQSVLTKGTGAVGRQGWGHRILTTGQLTLSCTALAVAGMASLAIGSAWDFGAELPSEEVALGSVDFSSPELGEEGDRRILRARLETELAERLPGRRIAVATSAPGWYELGEPVRRIGVDDTERPRRFQTTVGVGEGYFGLFDLRMVLGRSFSISDDENAPPVAIVNTAWVDEWADGRDPLTMDLVFPRTDSLQPVQIVGVVETARLGLGSPAEDARVFRPLAQRAVGPVVVMLRASEAPLEVIPELRRTLSEIDPTLALSDVRTLEEGHAFMTRAQRTLSSLAAGGGWAGLLVAAVGLYGLLSFHVRSRRRELGVRLSMGADGARLGREILARALRQLLPATALGLAAAWLGAPVLGGILLGLDARAPGIYLGVASVFIGVGILASLRPALAASRVRPADVLRED